MGAGAGAAAEALARSGARQRVTGVCQSGAPGLGSACGLIVGGVRDVRNPPGGLVGFCRAWNGARHGGGGSARLDITGERCRGSYGAPQAKTSSAKGRWGLGGAYRALGQWEGHRREASEEVARRHSGSAQAELEETWWWISKLLDSLDRLGMGLRKCCEG